MNLNPAVDLNPIKNLYNTNVIVNKKNFKFFDTLFDKISERLNNIDVLPWHLVTAALVLNAYSLLALIKKDFILFIILFISAIFTIKLENFYREIYNLDNSKEAYYSNVSEWILYLSVFIVYTKIYNKLLTKPRLALIFVILLLCNVNFTTRHLLMQFNNIELDKPIELWIKPFSSIPIDTVVNFHKLTRYFTEEYTIMYIVAILIYIEIRKRN